MKTAKIELPEALAKSSLESELNSFAYTIYNNSLMYIKGFKASTDNSDISADIAAFNISEENKSILEYFTKPNAAGMCVIDIEALNGDIEAMDKIVLRLHEFMESVKETDSVTSVSTPLFHKDEETESPFDLGESEGEENEEK